MKARRSRKKFLPYGLHSIDKQDILSVVKVLESDWLTTGPTIVAFEKKLARYTEARYAVAVSSATAALYLAVCALDAAGSEGITSPNTFMATSNALVHSGLKPVLADIDLKTYNIDPKEIAKKITKKTKVIIPVHFAGQPCKMKAIKLLAAKHNIRIIEDAAHAIGSKYENGKSVGSCYYSDMTVFSFHPVKTITTGEGGVVTTNSKFFYERLRILRNHGMDKNKKMRYLGYNFRLTDIQAALGISQMRKLKNFIRRRREIVSAYNRAFKNTQWLITPHEEESVFSAFHLYVVLIDYKKIKKSRSEVIEELRKKGVGSQVHYIPLHLQPFYRNRFGYKKGDFPKSEEYYQKCLSLPLYPALTDSDVRRVIKAILFLNSK